MTATEDATRAQPPLHSPRRHKFSRQILWAVLSYGVAGLCLYRVFHDIDFRELIHSLSAVNWWLLIPAAVFDLLVYVIAGWVWQILLRSVARLSMWRTTQAVFAGRFANDVLPVHVGYVVRVYLVSSWTRTKIASVAPSLLVERLFDGFWLALGIGLTAIFFPLPGKIARVAEMWAGIIVFGLVVGGFIVFRKPKKEAKATRGIGRWKWVQKGRATLEHVLEQVHIIGRSWSVLAAFGLSFVKFASQALAFLFVLWAYGFHFPFWTQLAVFLIAYVGISLPSTPASMGVFQLFCVAGLEMVHVPKPDATGFGMLAFVVLTVPLAVAGFIALAQSGLTLRQVRAEAGKRKWSDGVME